MNEFICIGPGPGPRNVMFRSPDGKLIVTAYALWKHKYKGAKLADKYISAAGFIQFDPREREVNGKNVTDVTIKTPGGEGVLVRVTIWPEFDLEGKVPEKGDFLAVDGKFSINTYEDKNGQKQSQAQISPYSLLLIKGAKKAEREVVQGGGVPDDKVPF